ncbi:GA module-containing protein [Anaerococcus urinomassiliensis]|uniref:GA module-containing protein n=1 Tax=Anaerococcus urinomassiliensis TaxID=1745712 RepID=UPI0009397432|nr:GA module-containing protein [Anaerococcus urinomassiliensis]
MVNKNKKIIAGAIILAMSISAITQTSYAASEDEIGVNSDVAIDENQGKDKVSHNDLKEDELGVEESDADSNKDIESGDGAEIDPSTNEDELKIIKESLKSDINLSDLSDDLKKDYSDQIDQAQNEEDLEEIEDQFFADLFEREDESSDEEADLTESSDKNNDKSSDDKELEISDLGKDSDQVSSEEGKSNLESKKEELRNKLVDAMASGTLDPMKLSEFTEKVASAESDEAIKAIKAEIYLALGEELPEEDNDTEPVEDDLAEERQLAKTQINEVATVKNMPEDLVKEYYARIDAAKDMDEMLDIVMEANVWEELDDPEEDPLKEERETYQNNIDKLEYIDEERKAYYKSKIDDASGSQEFRKILDEAQNENNENAPVEEFDFKGIYKDLIDGLENLSEDQKQGFKDQIDAVDEDADGAEDAIQEIWNEAQTQNEGQEPIEDQEELKELRELAKSVVDGLENLSEEEKQDFKNQLDEEKSYGGLNGVLDKAKDKDIQNEESNKWLESLREGYIAKLPSYKNLTEDQRSAYEKQFKEAKDQEAMRLIDYDAQTTNQDQEPVDENLDEKILEEYKALAVEEIEALENLTDEKVKEEFLNQVKAVKLDDDEDAFNIASEKINAIRAEAAAWKAEDDSLEKVKEAAKNEINALEKLTSEEKNNYLAEVDKANDKDSIDKAVESAKALNERKSDLEKAKVVAKDEIDNLANLSDGQKEDYVDQLDKANSKEVIDETVASAKAKDAENLKAAKEAAKSTIDKLEKINEDKKQSYKDEINRPTTDTIAKVNEIVSRAKNDSSEKLPEEDLLKANKDEYKKMIDNLPSLTAKEKKSFKEQIDKANSLDQIKSTYDKALEIVVSRKNNDGDIEYLRKYIIDRINELENLNDFSKEYFIAKVKDANTFESLFDFYLQAIKMDMQANGMIYVPIGFEFIESGYYYRSDLYNIRQELLEAYRDNRITAAAAKILMENYPNTVKNVREKLEKLIVESEELQKQAEAMLIEYDKILNLDYKAEI